MKKENNYQLSPKEKFKKLLKKSKALNVLKKEFGLEIKDWFIATVYFNFTAKTFAQLKNILNFADVERN